MGVISSKSGVMPYCMSEKASDTSRAYSGVAVCPYKL
jgi:hypothetical protein